MTRLAAFIIKYMVEYRSNEEREKGSGKGEVGYRRKEGRGGEVKKEGKNFLEVMKGEMIREDRLKSR